MEETTMIKQSRFMKPIAVAAAVAMIVALSVTVYAIATRLSPADVADELGQHALAEAFRGDESLMLNETIVSHGYEFTLHGIIIGSDLDEYSAYTDIDRESTYIVYSVANADGTPMNHFDNEKFFMQTVFFQGYRPWMLSSWTLGMSGSGFERDGVWYKVFKIRESIEWLADREVVFGIWDASVASGVSMAPGPDLIQIADDGKISFRDDLNAAHAMFTLPLDPANANLEALQDYLNERGEGDTLEWADVNTVLE
jgi:hypothetical protein